MSTKKLRCFKIAGGEKGLKKLLSNMNSKQK